MKSFRIRKEGNFYRILLSRLERLNALYTWPVYCKCAAFMSPIYPHRFSAAILLISPPPPPRLLLFCCWEGLWDSLCFWKSKNSFPAFPGRTLHQCFPLLNSSWSWATSPGHFQPISSATVYSRDTIFPKVGWRVGYRAEARMFSESFSQVVCVLFANVLSRTTSVTSLMVEIFGCIHLFCPYWGSQKGFLKLPQSKCFPRSICAWKLSKSRIISKWRLFPICRVQWYLWTYLEHGFLPDCKFSRTHTPALLVNRCVVAWKMYISEIISDFMAPLSILMLQVDLGNLGSLLFHWITGNYVPLVFRCYKWVLVALRTCWIELDTAFI